MNMHPQGGVAQGEAKPNAGVDVSKQHLDVCLGQSSWRVVNDPPGWDELTAKLLACGVDLVVLEATGGYERGLLCALQAAGVSVARLNPRQARDFAKSMGVLAKTDQVDARVLRDFADVLARHQQRAKYERRRECPDQNGDLLAPRRTADPETRLEILRRSAAIRCGDTDDAADREGRNKTRISRSPTKPEENQTGDEQGRDRHTRDRV